MNERIMNKLDRFLFLFHLETLAQTSGCGCSLRTGVEIISIVQIFYSFLDFTTNALIIGTTFHLFRYLQLVSLIMIIIASICVFFSSNSNNLNMAYYGYFLFSMEFYLDLFLMVLSITIKSYEIYDITQYGFRISLMYFMMLLVYISIIAAIKVYFLWIIYSYVKNFAKGDFNILDNIVNNEYLRINEQDLTHQNRM